MKSNLIIDQEIRLKLNLSKEDIQYYFEKLIVEIPDFKNEDLADFLGANFEVFEKKTFGKKLDLSGFSKRVRGLKNAEQFIYNLYKRNKDAAGNAKTGKHNFAVLLEKNFKGFEYQNHITENTYEEHILKLRDRIRDHDIKLKK